MGSGGFAAARRRVGSRGPPPDLPSSALLPSPLETALSGAWVEHSGSECWDVCNPIADKSSSVSADKFSLRRSTAARAHLRRAVCLSKVTRSLLAKSRRFTNSGQAENHLAEHEQAHGQSVVAAPAQSLHSTLPEPLAASWSGEWPGVGNGPRALGAFADTGRGAGGLARRQGFFAGWWRSSRGSREAEALAVHCEALAAAGEGLAAAVALHAWAEGAGATANPTIG